MWRRASSTPQSSAWQSRCPPATIRLPSLRAQYYFEAPKGNAHPVSGPRELCLRVRDLKVAAGEGLDFCHCSAVSTLRATRRQLGQGADQNACKVVRNQELAEAGARNLPGRLNELPVSWHDSLQFMTLLFCSPWPKK